MTETDDIVGRLQHIPVGRPDVDLRLMPDFMIIGPQRTGTTWLAMALREHPDVFLSTPKEPLFFSSLPKPLKKHPGSPDDLAGYLQLFDNPEAKAAVATGEASAHYAVALHWFPDLLDEVFSLNPNLKIIGIVRDPIERTWSHAKLDLCRYTNRKVADVPFEEWERFITNRYARDAANYENTFTSWKERAKPGCFAALKFRDIEARPEAALQQVHEFLQLRTGPDFIPNNVKERRNQSTPDVPPPELQQLLSKTFEQEVRHLREADWI